MGRNGTGSARNYVVVNDNWYVNGFHTGSYVTYCGEYFFTLGGAGLTYCEGGAEGGVGFTLGGRGGCGGVGATPGPPGIPFVPGPAGIFT